MQVFLGKNEENRIFFDFALFNAAKRVSFFVMIWSFFEGCRNLFEDEDWF